MSLKPYSWTLVFMAAIAAAACDIEPANTTVDPQHGAATPPGVADTNQTPDGLITTTIQGKYAVSDEVKGYKINVNTDNGVVTLIGTVDSPAHRVQAVQIAEGTQGVRSVRDQLTVHESAATTGTTLDNRARDRASEAGNDARDAGRRVGEAIDDGWITTRLKSKFLVDDSVKGRNIDITTKDGVVTITGTVGSEAQKTAAERLVRDTEGVKRVVNNLRIGSV